MGKITQSDFMSIYIALFVILTVGVVLRHVLRNATEKVRHIPLMVLTVVLLLLEIAKQTYHIVCGDWVTWYIPLHFCSYFLVWFTVALCTRGKVRQTMYACSLTGGIIVSILLLITPQMILHEATTNIFGKFNYFHTYFYHMGVMAYWIWMLMLKVYHHEPQHFRYTIILHVAFFFATIIGAHTFHENFTNVLGSDIKVLEELRVAIGQFPYTMLLLLIGIGSIALVSGVTHLVVKKLYRQNLNQDELKNN